MEWILLASGILVLTTISAALYRRRGRQTDKLPVPPAGVSEGAKESHEVATFVDQTAAVAVPSTWQRLKGVFKGKGSALETGEWGALEEALLAGDVGITTTEFLLKRVKDRAQNEKGALIRDLITDEGEKLLSGLQHGRLEFSGKPNPVVISIVGVNGAGKTTTVGKLAEHFIRSGQTVLIGAGDTFRAAAIGQLKVWAERVGADFVTGREGADPGAVAFDAITAARARGKSVVLFDTAGRLHTKSNLMDELKKIHRVMKKVIPDAPHETWLVLDGTLGQNSMAQAKEFQKSLELTGLIVTKLDGTAKGGAVLAISTELKLPIRYIGLGESAEDLMSFEPRPFIAALLGA